MHATNAEAFLQVEINAIRDMFTFFFCLQNPFNSVAIIFILGNSIALAHNTACGGERRIGNIWLRYLNILKILFSDNL